MENGDVDKAAWTRFSTSSGRCLVCGHKATVSITLSAREITGDRGGGMLASERQNFCHDHAMQRYPEALMKVRGTSKV